MLRLASRRPSGLSKQAQPILLRYFGMSPRVWAAHEKESEGTREIKVQEGEEDKKEGNESVGVKAGDSTPEPSPAAQASSATPVIAHSKPLEVTLAGTVKQLKEVADAARGAKLTIIGLPHDANSSFLRGAAEAPEAVRYALTCPSSNTFAENGIDTAKHVKDVGDLVLPNEQTDDARKEAHHLIRVAVLSLLSTEHTPVVIGGDHSVTYPVVQAFAAAYPNQLNILHFDAHPDLYSDFDNNRFSHASPFARIAEEGLVKRIVQVGVRAVTKEAREMAAKHNVELIEMRTLGTSLAKVNFEGPVYISIDLDALDPAFAPGVSHHEPGGMAPRALIATLQRLRGQIVGGDVVELNPRRDLCASAPGAEPRVPGMTAMVAAKLIKELAGIIAAPASDEPPTLTKAEKRAQKRAAKAKTEVGASEEDADDMDPAKEKEPVKEKEKEKEKEKKGRKRSAKTAEAELNEEFEENDEPAAEKRAKRPARDAKAPRGAKDDTDGKADAHALGPIEPKKQDAKRSKQGDDALDFDDFNNEDLADDDEFDRSSRDRGQGPRCFNCQQTGHFARDCPEPRTASQRSERGGFGERGSFDRERRNDACFKCGEPGHRAANCPNSRFGDGNRRSSFGDGARDRRPARRDEFRRDSFRRDDRFDNEARRGGDRNKEDDFDEEEEEEPRSARSGRDQDSRGGSRGDRGLSGGRREEGGFREGDRRDRPGPRGFRGDRGGFRRGDEE